MNYTIRILEKEIELLKNALSAWETKTYPEAKKLREDRLWELQRAVEILKKEFQR
jgi:hypothetical protein